MKNNRWIFWIVAWTGVLILSLFLLLSPFHNKNTIKATDFISDSVGFVGFIYKIDSLHCQRLFFLPAETREEICRDAFFLQKFCDSLLVAGYNLKNSKHIVWICKKQTKITQEKLEFPWIIKEKDGWFIFSKNKDIVDHVLQNSSNENSFTKVYESFEKLRENHWFFRDDSMLFLHHYNFCSCADLRSWKRYIVQEDTILCNLQIECINSQIESPKATENLNSIFVNIPSLADCVYVSVKINREFANWNKILPFPIVPPCGWFDIYQKRVWFGWIDTIDTLEKYSQFYTNFSTNIPLKFRTDSHHFYFLNTANKVAYWCCDSSVLQDILQLVSFGNNLLKRNRFLSVLSRIPSSFLEVHVALEEFPRWKIHHVLFNRNICSYSRLKNSTPDDFLLPPHFFCKVVQHPNDAYILLHGQDGFAYILTPSQHKLVKLLSLIPRISNAYVFSSSTSEKLFVLLDSNQLFYIQNSKKNSVPGKLNLHDAIPQTISAIYLKNPPGWRIVFLNKKGNLVNIQLSGLPSSGWKPKLPKVSSNPLIMGNDEYYFVKDKNFIYILNRTGKQIYKGTIFSSFYFSGDSTWWIGQEKKLFIFYKKKIQKFSLPSSVEDLEILHASAHGAAISNNQNLLITNDFIHWKKYFLPFKNNEITKILIRKIQNEWKGYVLLKTSQLYAFQVDLKDDRITIENYYDTYADICYDNYHVFGILFNRNAIRKLN
ncbi:MAG: hypothetical protein N2Z72_00045 [Bacteroidales bacterium]|nr:hypothetical protein [Bacteroidales bacterium]